MENQKLPNATAVIVLGILSIITCCCYGFGLILAIIAIVLANKDTKLYNENPQLYSNYSNIKTGRILSYIGLIMSLLFIVYIICLISYFGIETMQNPELMRQKMEELMRR